MLIDLQLHSTYSDGYLTPTELAKFIAQEGVKVAALTDHNTVSGLEEFRLACKKYKIKPIAGIEIYTKLDLTKLNLLWYNFDEIDPELHKVLRNSQIRRRSKVRKTLAQLKKKGFKINIDKVLDKFTHYVPINRIVNNILSVRANRQKIKKHLQLKKVRERDVIKEYFKNKSHLVLHESYIDIKRVLALREKIGGQLILNHPGRHNRLRRELLVKLKKIGIDGIEVLSPHHSVGAIMLAQALAREFNFIATGGSDFHRHEGGGMPVQNSWEYFKIDSKQLRGVKKIIG